MARHESKTGSPWQYIIFLSLFLLLTMSAATAFCDVDELIEADTEEDAANTPAEEIKPYYNASAQTGYRFVTPDGPVAASSPYARLKSGVSGGFSAARLGSDLKLTMDGMYLHEDDYHTELFFDYAGYYRLHLETAVMWHNLLSETLPRGTPSFTTQQLDPGAVYGTRTSISQVENRIKLGNNPFHLNLGYWQLTKDGSEQLIFSDYFNGGTNLTNNIYAQRNRIDRITREGTVGLDGHLKWFDLSYIFRIRDFSNETQDNRFPFSNTANGSLIAGLQAHDTIPDNRGTSHSIKLYSDLSGGLVGTAAYTLTQRENTGGHSDVLASSQPSDTIHNMAGDLSYTPSKKLSFALKYRHQEIDRDTPLNVFYPFATAGLLQVRPASDTVKDDFILSSILKPYPKMIYRLEYSAELESRNNVRNQQSAITEIGAIHSDSRQIHTGKISFYWRPSIINMKVNASYSYSACDNPAYGSSFSERHDGKLILTYTNSGKWGLTGSYLARYENADNTAATAAPSSTTIVTPSGAASFKLPREGRNNSANASIWFSPLERLTITTGYSFLDSDIDQSLLFTNQSPSSLSKTNYHSTAHVYEINAVYAAAEKIDFSLLFQQVFSKSRFDAAYASYISSSAATPGLTTVYSTAGITELTLLDTTETGVTARADWRLTDMLGCALDYSFRLFNSGNPAYDGSVHTTMLSLKAKW